MPEGHVSHRNAQRLAPLLVGAGPVTVEAPEPRLAGQRLPERLSGRAVRAVEAVGKHMLIRFEGGETLASHLGMVGSWRVAAADAPLRRAGLWLVISTGRHAVTQYRGPHLRLMGDAEATAGLGRVGPDLLAGDVDPARAVEERLRGVDPDVPIGVALLDQGVVAGIGNVYKSETLFLCGVHPWRRTGDVTDEEARAIGETAGRLLADGVRDQGRIVTYRRPGAAPSRHGGRWVYGRPGRACRRCGTPVRSRGQGDDNRTTYWCPSCQA